VNCRSASASTRRQCLSQIRGLDVAVIRVEDAAREALGVAHRPEFADIRRRQESNVDADRSRRRRILIVLVHAIVIHRKTQIANLRESDRLTCGGLKFLVELYRILVNLPNAVTHVEQW